MPFFRAEFGLGLPRPPPRLQHCHFGGFVSSARFSLLLPIAECANYVLLTRVRFITIAKQYTEIYYSLQ